MIQNAAKSSAEPLKGPPAQLEKLPFELLSHLYAHLSTAQSVHHLSLTCRVLNKFTQQEGWKVFVRERFPSFQIPPNLHNYADAAHGLTTLSRNWDRKAFLARYIQPYGFIIESVTGNPIGKWRSPSGQTMGYQPSMDSYEEWLGAAKDKQGHRWSDRRQVLAWSAGAELIIRVQETGSKAFNRWQNSGVEERTLHFDDLRNLTRWLTWRQEGSREGRDDITSVKLVKPFQRQPINLGNDSILVGSASGNLDLISTHDEVLFKRIFNYATNDRPVRSTDISESVESPLIVAGLSDSTLALYPLIPSAEESSVKPISDCVVIPTSPQAYRIWTTEFISESRIAVGIGPSTHPLHVFQVTPTGIEPEPIRKFGLKGTLPLEDNVDVETGTARSSIYPISPLPQSSCAGRTAGEVFLSGAYDGIIRLHDMRCSDAYVSGYWDPTDDSPIFSLQTIGRERLVAGSSRHSIIKLFDLRVAGGRAYHYIDASATLSSSTPNFNSDQISRDGWNVFLSSSNSRQPRQSRGHSWSRESPIYSLSRPSSVSPVLFAGLENAVVQLDFAGMLDRYPDPVYRNSLCRVPKTGQIDVKKTWNSRGRVSNLAMYKQGANEMKMMTQDEVGHYSTGHAQKNGVEGLDERWANNIPSRTRW